MFFHNRLLPAALLLILSPAAPAFAGQCEDSFDTKAKILGTTRFSAQVELPGLTADSAFGQLRTILPNYGVRIIHEDPNAGQMNAETIESMAGKGYPVDVYYSNAAGRGLVQISYSRKTNLLKKKSGVQDQLCGILNQLAVRETSTGGKDNARRISGAINVDSIRFSQQVMASSDNPARLRALFEGRDYSVTGRVLAINEPKKKRYVVMFEGDRIGISCKLDGKQDRAAALFQVGRRETLIGRFKEYDPGKKGAAPAIMLENCKAP